MQSHSIIHLLANRVNKQKKKKNSVDKNKQQHHQQPGNIHNFMYHNDKRSIYCHLNANECDASNRKSEREKKTNAYIKQCFEIVNNEYKCDA